MNPHWNDDTGGALVGLRADHGPEHLYRAICEGLAFEHRMIFELIERDTRPLQSIVAVGGGAKSPFLLSLFSTVLDRALSLSESDETTALGAAILAAPSAGLAPSVLEAARAMAKVRPGAEPSADAGRYRKIYERAYRGLYTALAPTLGALST
jgi:xylulokinase